MDKDYSTLYVICMFHFESGHDIAGFASFDMITNDATYEEMEITRFRAQSSGYTGDPNIAYYVTSGGGYVKFKNIKAGSKIYGFFGITTFMPDGWPRGGTNALITVLGE